MRSVIHSQQDHVTAVASLGSLQTFTQTVGQLSKMYIADPARIRNKVSTLTSQGVDEAEIGAECVIGDLMRLGSFRSLLRVAAEVTGRSLADLNHVLMNLIPSFAIEEAIQTHGQQREKLPGSDLHDRHLAVLAAYCDVLYVDRRASEDLLRVRRKAPILDSLMGEVRKATAFEALLDKQ